MQHNTAYTLCQPAEAVSTYLQKGQDVHKKNHSTQKSGVASTGSQSCSAVMLSQREVLTGPHWDPAGGESPVSTFVAAHLALEHPWECCILDKRSAQERRQTPGHVTISQLSEHSSWGLHIHSLLLYMSCKTCSSKGLRLCGQ